IPLRLGPSSLCCSHVRRLLVKCRRADRPGLPPPLAQTPRNCPAVDRYAVARAEQQDAPIEIGSRERRLAREPWQTKRPPEGGLGKSMLDVLDALSAIRFFRYAMKPNPAKPKIIIAQVEGSGTPGAISATSSVPVSFTKAGGRALKK